MAWICEFSRSQVSLLAEMVHLYLKEYPDHEVAQEILDALVEQTENVVSRNPARHLTPNAPFILQPGQELVTTQQILLWNQYGNEDFSF